MQVCSFIQQYVENNHVFVACPIAPAAAHADVSLWSDDTGTVAIYTCWTGFHFVERSSIRSIVCIDGKWINNISDCISTYVMSRCNIINCNVLYDISYNSMILSCNMLRLVT